jgi:hypothetical protein
VNVQRHPPPALATHPAPTLVAPLPPPPTNIPTTPATERINLRVSVEGPAVAQIFIDGELAGPSPFDADVGRDAEPAPGQPATVHVVEARAEGWQSPPQSVPFRFPQRVTIRMEQAGGRPSSGRHHRLVATAPPPSAPVVAPTPIVRPPPATPTQHEELVGSRRIF